eukprot:tig00000444_g818.t1
MRTPEADSARAAPLLKAPRWLAATHLTLSPLAHASACTVCYCLCLFLIGLTGSFVPASLPALARQTGASISSLGALFSARSGGVLVACLSLPGPISGPRGHQWVAAAGLLQGLTLAAVPRASSAFLVVALFACNGFGVGAQLLGGNTLMQYAWVAWPARAPLFLSLMHALAGAGLLLSPILYTLLATPGAAYPFFGGSCLLAVGVAALAPPAPGPAAGPAPPAELGDLEQAGAREKASAGSARAGAMTPRDAAARDAVRAREAAHADERLPLAALDAAPAPGPAGLRPRPSTPGPPCGGAGARAAGEAARGVAGRGRRALVVTAAVCLALYQGAEASFGSWIFEFDVEELEASPRSAAAATSLFYSALSAGRLAALPLLPLPAVARRPVTLLLAAAALTALSLGPLFALGRLRASVWLAAAGAGVGMSVVYPTTLALPAKLAGAPVTAGESALITATGCGGAILLPLLVGVLFPTRAGPLSLPTLCLVAQLLLAAAAARLLPAQRRRQRLDDERQRRAAGAPAGPRPSLTLSSSSSESAESEGAPSPRTEPLLVVAP